MRLRFTKTITVDGVAYQAGDEENSAMIGSGYLDSLVRLGHVEEVTPEELAKRAKLKREAAETAKREKAAIEAAEKAERERAAKAAAAEAKLAAAEAERQAKAAAASQPVIPAATTTPAAPTAPPATDPKAAK